MKRCVRVLSTFQLLLNYFERFLSAAHDHHSTECCSAEKEEQNAGVDGGAREITAPGCTKIGIIVIACCCCPVARIINRAAREIRVSTRKLVARCHCRIASLASHRVCRQCQQNRGQEIQLKFLHNYAFSEGKDEGNGEEGLHGEMVFGKVIHWCTCYPFAPSFASALV